MQKKSTFGKTILSCIFFFVLFAEVSAQNNCGCDTILKLTRPNFDGGYLQPGQTICLEAGTRTQNLTISNLTGSKANPIIIKNCSGKVTFNIPTSTPYALWIKNSVNFHLTGTGSSDTYGIELAGSVNALQVGALSTDFEVDHIEARNANFAGIMAKTDSSGPRSGFKMKNVSIHDNYSHDLGGEGFYIGNTSWKLNGYQHDIDSLYVFNNTTNNTGREGVQVGCTYSGNAWVHHNIITNSGTLALNQQDNGIQIGSGFAGQLYDNYVETCHGNGIICTGIGNVYVFNNMIIHPGAFGIYSGRETAEGGKTFHYIHNTIVMGTDANAAIKFDPDTSSIAKIYNNIVQRTDTIPANTFVRVSGTMYTEGNVIRSSAGSFKFVNAAAQNYDLQAGSAAIDTASSIIDTFHISNLRVDYANRPRPVGRYDAGAYEYQSSGGGEGDTGIAIYRVNAGGLQVNDSPINWINDKQQTPCAYFDNTVPSNQTTGSDLAWGGTNNTDAPSQVFSTIRYAGTSANQVHYNFPVNNGDYIVNLYFAENTVTSAGQRVEDVSIEGALKMDNFDIYATAGFQTAYKASFTVTVSDDVLDVNFARVTGNPQINAIEIRSLNGGARVINPPVTLSAFNSPENFAQNLKIYPVPLENRLYIEKKGTGDAVNASEEVQVTLYNDMGSVLYRAKHTFSGGKLDPIDLTKVYMRSGTYFIAISGNATNGTIRLSKN